MWKRNEGIKVQEDDAREMGNWCVDRMEKEPLEPFVFQRAGNTLAISVRCGDEVYSWITTIQKERID